MKTLEFYQKALLPEPSLEQAQNQRRAFRRTGAHERTWRHVKTGNMYLVMSTSVNEVDKVVLVHYMGQKESALPSGEGVLWSRPLKEFLDGRFVPVESGY